MQAQERVDDLTRKGEVIDRIIREQECARITGLGRSTRHRLIQKGEFPAPVPLTGAPWCRGWLLSEIMDWLRSRAAKRGEAA